MLRRPRAGAYPRGVGRGTLRDRVHAAGRVRVGRERARLGGRDAPALRRAATVRTLSVARPDLRVEPPPHTQTFNGPLSRTTRVGRYQKGKTSLDFT